MKRVALVALLPWAAISSVAAVAARPAAATAPPIDVNELEYMAWSLVNGVVPERIACDVAEVITCYGLDTATGTIVAGTRNADGTFTALKVASPSSSTGGGTAVVPSGDVGTRSNPIPLGTAAEIGDGWSLTINRVDPDAWAAIEADFSFNDPPPEGSVYVMVNITSSYNGFSDKEIDMWSVSGVTSSDVELNTYDTFVLAPDSYDGLAEVFAGGSKSGNIVFTVPAAEVDSLVLYASATWDGDDVYFATR